LDLINEQCQQVFRNYIDKYKNNVHFVSVCSNVQKVIESVQSRVHILRLKPPTQEEIRGIIDKIVKYENIHMDESAKQYIQHFSNNSLREIINHLEKIHILQNEGDNTVDNEKCKRICSNISSQLFENYLIFLREKQLAKAIQILYNIHDYGYSVIDIFDYFFSFVKSTHLLNEDEKYQIIPYLCKYITYFYSIHENIIELSLFTRDISKIL
jgi:DNA polymerase III gamma/tau subunit